MEEGVKFKTFLTADICTGRLWFLMLRSPKVFGGFQRHSDVATKKKSKITDFIKSNQRYLTLSAILWWFIMTPQCSNIGNNWSWIYILLNYSILNIIQTWSLLFKQKYTSRLVLWRPFECGMPVRKLSGRFIHTNAPLKRWFWTVQSLNHPF